MSDTTTDIAATRQELCVGKVSKEVTEEMILKKTEKNRKRRLAAQRRKERRKVWRELPQLCCVRCSFNRQRLCGSCWRSKAKRSRKIRYMP